MDSRVSAGGNRVLLSLDNDCLRAIFKLLFHALAPQDFVSCYSSCKECRAIMREEAEVCLAWPMRDLYARWQEFWSSVSAFLDNTTWVDDLVRPRVVGCVDVTPFRLETLALVAEHGELCQLEDLVLESGRVFNNVFSLNRSVLELVRQLPSLQTLALRVPGVGLAGLTPALLAGPRSLERLCLDYTLFADAECVALAEAIERKELPRLASVSLRGCEEISDGVKERVARSAACRNKMCF